MEIEKVQKQMSVNMGKIAFWYFTNLGIPPEFFSDWVGKFLKNDRDILKFCINFYRKNEKYCKENGVVVNYHDIVSSV
jgi:hypothetical protein